MTCTLKEYVNYCREKKHKTNCKVFDKNRLNDFTPLDKSIVINALVTLASKYITTIHGIKTNTQEIESLVEKIKSSNYIDGIYKLPPISNSGFTPGFISTPITTN